MQEVWVDIDEAPREIMLTVFAQYRDKVRAELCQIKNDLDHYNEYRNKDGAPIIFVFDFTADIEEHLMLGKQIEPPIDKGIRLVGRP
jgi:hypothetical protein